MGACVTACITVYEPYDDGCDGVDAGWNNLFQANKNNTIKAIIIKVLIEIILIYIYKIKILNIK